jgi:hypothetical protein
MKRRVLIIVPVLTVLVALVALGAMLATRPAPSAQARGGGWQLVQFPAYLDGVCSFRMDFNFSQAQEYQKSEAQPDGTVVTQFTGAIKLAVTNHGTGKTLTYNISGPGTLTTYLDGSTFLVGEGAGLQFFPPAAQQQFNLPAAAYIKGRFTTATDAHGNVTAFTHDGATISDACAALS